MGDLYLYFSVFRFVCVLCIQEKKITFTKRLSPRTLTNTRGSLAKLASLAEEPAPPPDSLTPPHSLLAVERVLGYSCFQALTPPGGSPAQHHWPPCFIAQARGGGAAALYRRQEVGHKFLGSHIGELSLDASCLRK